MSRCLVKLSKKNRRSLIGCDTYLDQISLSHFKKNWHNRFPTGMKTRFGQAFIVQLSKNRRKLWRTHLKDNGWNSIWANGLGCIKIVDCMKNHFGSAILRAKFHFSTRWKIGKLLGDHHQGWNYGGMDFPLLITLLQILQRLRHLIS